MSALILAGGMGTRLQSVLPGRQKVSAMVGGRLFVSYLLDQLEAAGIRHVVLCTGYQAETLEQALGARHGAMTLAYSRETEPLGTGGALRRALPMTAGPTILAMNGDSYVDCPLATFIDWHRQHQFAGSLLLTWVRDAARFGTVEVDPDGRVRAFLEKQGLPEPGWINAGVYLLARSLLESLPPDRPVSIEREAFPLWQERGLGGFARQAKFLDIGTPESLALAEAFLTQADSRPKPNAWQSD